MRIRTQLIASLIFACAVTLLLIVGSAHVTRQARAGLEEQAEAQQVARDLANMLSLTNEFSAFGGARAAAQWHVSYALLQKTIERALQRHDLALPALHELNRDIEDLPALFDKLQEIGVADTPFTQRRRDLLLDRLLSETQEVVESRHRWAIAVGEAQQRDERRYAVMVMATPFVFLLLILSLGFLISQRILAPLERLKTSAAAVQAGDLNWRCASDAPDELGDAARAVDAMATALQRQSAELRESEQRLRMITDNLPAAVGYVDSREVFRFSNALCTEAFGGSPQALIGRTISEVLGAPARAALAPHIEAALRGERLNFERHGMGNKPQAVFSVDYIPQRNAVGGIDGFLVMALDVTTSRQAEWRQAASERLLVQITDNLPALVAYMDRDLCYRFANRRYAEWLGVDHHAMIGRHVIDAVGKSFYDDISKGCGAALRGERVRWERRAMRDGQEAYFMADFIPDIDAAGEVQGFYALTVDTTERHQAELAMAHNEQRLYDLTNNIPAMVGYFDMDERCRYANEMLLRSQGLERAEVPGITLRTALGEASYAQYRPFVQQALEGRRARLEGQIPFEGRAAHFQAHLIPDRIDGGAQRGFYLMNFDITALKEAQAKQGLVERKLLDITDNLPVLITYIDANERCTFINATCQQWFGVSASTLVGRTMTELMTPAAYEQRRPHLAMALAGQRQEFDIETETPADRQKASRHVHTVYVPDVRADGQVAGIYAISSDVTALKQVERQLSLWARIDTLTELPNRRQYEERFAEAIARASRDNKPIGVMFLDIDHFKSINDSRGHAAGDQVLREFASRLKGAVRVTDLPARFAGDEFVVLLEGLHGSDDAARVAQKVLEAMRVPFTVDETEEGSELSVTTSIGVAFAPHPVAGTALMSRADQVLYQAKAAGRNTFRLGLVEPPAQPLPTALRA